MWRNNCALAARAPSGQNRAHLVSFHARHKMNLCRHTRQVKPRHKLLIRRQTHNCTLVGNKAVYCRAYSNCVIPFIFDPIDILDRKPAKGIRSSGKPIAKAASASSLLCPYLRETRQLAYRNTDRKVAINLFRWNRADS